MKALSHRGRICHPSKCSEILMIKMRSICCTCKPVRAGRSASLTFCALAFCCVGKFSSPSIITQNMQDYVRSGCCRKRLHWREQSLEMCDLYSTAPNAFVLLRSCISSAFSLSRLLSLFPHPPSFHLMLSLPAATHLVRGDLSRATTLGAALPDFLLLLAVFQCHLSSQSFHFLSHCPARSMSVVVG